MKTPGSLYHPSRRSYAGLSDLQYPFHDRSTTVTECGRICMERKKVNLSTVLAGQLVGVRQVDDQVWQVSIRQFQQVGGPPVGVWRELRRVEGIPEGAPDHLVKAHRAVNKLANIEGRENASVAWDHYCEAQGGVFCGRDARIKLAMVAGTKPGRYGDEPTPRPVGIETTASVDWPVPWMPGYAFRREVLWEVLSTRHEWEIIRAHNGDLIERASDAEQAQPAQPWTRVNNCTQVSAAAAFATPEVVTPPEGQPTPIPLSGRPPRLGRQTTRPSAQHRESGPSPALQTAAG